MTKARPNSPSIWMAGRYARDDNVSVKDDSFVSCTRSDAMLGRLVSTARLNPLFGACAST